MRWVPPRKRRLTREESKARTRAELLRAASRLFVRNGYVATSLADIAEEAALTKGAVYSNFDSKEELFLALLQETAANEWSNQSDLAPSDLASGSGDTPEERAANWGRSVAAIRRNRRNVALFLEMNAAALRSDRTRAWVADHNQAFFRVLGARLGKMLDADESDAEVLGLVAQSLYVGLMMHEAFGASALDVTVYERAYRLLAELAHDGPALVEPAAEASRPG